MQLHEMRENTPLSSDRSPVTVHVRHNVKAGHSSEIQKKISRTLALACESDGFLGATITNALSADATRFDTVVRFQSQGQLDRWRNRKETLEAISAEFVHLEEPTAVELADSSLTWFMMPREALSSPPPKWKMAVVSWLAIFPLLTMMISVTSPFLGHLHLAVRLFVTTLLVAPLMTWIVMPTMTKLFRPWLFRNH